MFDVVARVERFSENYSEYKRHKRLENDRSLPEVYIHWGPPGSGKTKWMDDTYGKTVWTRHPDNTTKWNDGCDCDVILFDDIKVNEITSIVSSGGLMNPRYHIESSNVGSQVSII